MFNDERIMSDGAFLILGKLVVCFLQGKHQAERIYIGDYELFGEALLTMCQRHLECVDYEGEWELFKKLDPAGNVEDSLENLQYFYHPDHLGSAAVISFTSGRAYQHLQYFPFGELFVSQRNSSFDSRYKFSAKELDNETGYSYFGARYYDSDLSSWLSVDPLSDKYPSLSPYAYCAGNPIVLKDTDGRKIVPTNSEGEAAIRGYVNSFNEDVQMKVFKISYSGPDGGKNNYSEYPEYSSMSVKGYDQYSDFKSFEIAMKSNGAKLNKQELKEAHGFYLALISEDTYTIDGVVSGTNGKTFKPGTESSKVVDNVMGYREREVYNDNLNSALINYQNDPNQNIDIIFNPENADKSGSGFVYFKNQVKNSTTKGAIFLDTRNANWQNNLGNAFKTVFDIK